MSVSPGSFVASETKRDRRPLAADGRRVQAHELRNGHTWSVIALPASLYTVQVFDARGVVYTARVVKQ